MGNKPLGPSFGKRAPAGALRDGHPHLPSPINAFPEKKMLPYAQPVLMSSLFDTLNLSSEYISPLPEFMLEDLSFQVKENKKDTGHHITVFFFFLKNCITLRLFSW